MFPLPATASAASFVDAGALENLPLGGQTTVFVDFMRVLVCRTVDDQLYAMADLCPHAMQPLAGGAVSDGSIVCPKHAACFDLATGKPRNAVTKKSLARYEVRLREGRVEVGPPIK